MSYASVMAEQKAQILAILAAAQEDLVCKQILRQMASNVTIERMQYLLRLLVDAKAIHISRTYGATRFYRTGPDTGKAAPTPAERILFALAELGPQTAQQLQDTTGLSRAYCCEIINRDLRPETGPKRIYIRKYIKQGNLRIFLYDIGNRPDAVRPKPLSDAEKARRKRARLLADADRLEQYRMKNRLSKVKPRADSFMSQFAGVFGSRQAA